MRNAYTTRKFFTSSFSCMFISLRWREANFHWNSQRLGICKNFCLRRPTQSLAIIATNFCWVFLHFYHQPSFTNSLFISLISLFNEFLNSLLLFHYFLTSLILSSRSGQGKRIALAMYASRIVRSIFRSLRNTYLKWKGWLSVIISMMQLFEKTKACGDRCCFSVAAHRKSKSALKIKFIKRTKHR